MNLTGGTFPRWQLDYKESKDPFGNDRPLDRKTITSPLKAFNIDALLYW